MAVRIVTRLRYLNNNHDSDLYLVSLPYFPCSPIFTYRYSHTHTHTQALKYYLERSETYADIH